MATRRRKSRKPKKGTYVSTKSGKICVYRSGWELVYFQYLDENPDVLHWESENFIIEYVSNHSTGRLRKYIPDFYVEYADGTKTVEEIKPSKKLTQRLILKKHNMADVWCREKGYEFRIITEIELKELGLL